MQLFCGREGIGTQGASPPILSLNHQILVGVDRSSPVLDMPKMSTFFVVAACNPLGPFSAEVLLEQGIGETGTRLGLLLIHKVKHFRTYPKPQTLNSSFHLFSPLS